MRDDVHVDRLRPEEWPRLRALRLRALSDSPDAFASTLERERAFDDALWQTRAADTPYFVARSGGELVGMLAVLAAFPPDEDSGAVVGEGDLEVLSMWVDPEHRRHGVGSKLLDEAVVYGRSTGASALCLWVADGNASAVSFYESAGFERTGGHQKMPRSAAREEHQLRRPL